MSTKAEELAALAAKFAELSARPEEKPEELTLAALCDVSLVAPLFSDGVSEKEVVDIRNVLRRVVLPWETDNAKPVRHVRKNLLGEKVCCVDTHAGEDPHDPDSNGVTWAVTPRHTKIKPKPDHGIKTGKNCVFRSKVSCDKALDDYGDGIVNLKEWKP